MDEFAEEEVVENPTLRAAYNLAPLHQNQPLRWDYKAHLIGEKIYDKVIHLCEVCELPILVYGRMLPCKHIFCFECARKCDKSCRRCNAKVQKVEKSALGTVFVCTHGAPKHSTKGCRRTYLSQRDLQSHIAHRHLPKASAPSTKPQTAPPPVQPVPNQLPLTQQQAAQQAAQKQMTGASPATPHPSSIPSHLQSSPQAGQTPLVVPVSSHSHPQPVGVASPTPPLIPGLGDVRPMATVAPSMMAHNSPLVHPAPSANTLPPPQGVGLPYVGAGQANPDIYRPLDMATMGQPHQQHHQQHQQHQQPQHQHQQPQHQHQQPQHQHQHQQPQHQHQQPPQHQHQQPPQHQHQPPQHQHQQPQHQHQQPQHQHQQPQHQHQQHQQQPQHHQHMGMTSPHMQANQPLQQYPQSLQAPSQSLQPSNQQHQPYPQPQQFPVSTPPMMQQMPSQQMTSTMAGPMHPTHPTTLHQHPPLSASQPMDGYNKPQNIPSAGQASQSRTNVNLITVPIQDEGQYRPLPYVNPSMASQSSASSFPQGGMRPNLPAQSQTYTQPPISSASFSSPTTFPQMGGQTQSMVGVGTNSSQGLPFNPAGGLRPNSPGLMVNPRPGLTGNIHSGVPRALAGMVHAMTMAAAARAQGGGLMPTPGTGAQGVGNRFPPGGRWAAPRVIQPRMTQSPQRPRAEGQFNPGSYYN